MRKIISFIAAVVICSIAFGQNILDDVFKDVFLTESKKYPYDRDHSVFKEFLFMRNTDSVSSKFKYSLKNDTMYIVDIHYLEGGMGYSIWNRADTISRFYPHVITKKIIPIEKRLTDWIENWDTCNLNRTRDKSWLDGWGNYYILRIIIKDCNYTIESVNYEF